MQCPFCKEEIQDGATKCKHCKSTLHNQESFSSPLFINEQCIEGIKTTNCPCLWVSLDYWNFYYGDKLIAVRCYRGKWGLIGFIIGLFFAIVGFLVTGSLGVLLDKSQGEAKCNLMKDKLSEVISGRNKYKIVESTWSAIKEPDVSDLCLGSLWLKYKIELDGKTFYFEDSKYQQIDAILKKYKQHI